MFLKRWIIAQIAPTFPLEYTILLDHLSLPPIGISIVSAVFAWLTTIHFTCVESLFLFASKFSLEVVAIDTPLKFSVIKMVYRPHLCTECGRYGPKS